MCASEARRSLALAWAAAFALALTGLGCVEHGLQQWITPFDYSPIEVPEPAPPQEGAIWRGESFSGSFLFFDQKARGVGDLLTVVIREDVRAEGRATTDTARDGQVDIGLSSDVGFADFAFKAFRKFFSWFVSDPGAAGNPGEVVNVLKSNAENNFAGEGATSRSGRFSGVITCRVVAVLPGDVFHIRGRRALLVNHEEQFLTLEALVRTEDISIDNTVLSASLAEARLTMDGVGVVDDKQRPGWGTRIFDWFYPF